MPHSCGGITGTFMLTTAAPAFGSSMLMSLACTL
jgi:hypothetical protein